MQSDAKSQAIALMLDTMQHSLPDMKTAMTVYCGVVADVDQSHVKQAVWRFLRGDVPRANHAFCPSPPEFSIEARRIAELDRLRNTPAIEARPIAYRRNPNSFLAKYERGEIQVTPEAREQLHKRLAGGRNANPHG